jgi:hypothetical protein
LDKNSLEFFSLAKTPRVIYWDREGLLNYYTVDYSSEFVMTKDWDNVTFDLEWYRISPKGKSELIRKERNVKCE